ncbi:nickel import ATP-binding protein NikE [Planococcus alpniumensis]|uniref:nickel import ATP-binding protein NikE n=1 Tax=Planococcus alpniumensis TaxID=2708345 RepID=UPI001B8BEE7E|nr:nickel import ATP-binding protein NikE [Planococcus sp. MSAK28401]
MSLLEVKDITHSYGASRSFWRKQDVKPVLSGISLSIEEGTCLGLLGSSGAGKSTLGKVILGLEKPQQGQVIFQGQDVYAMDAKSRQQMRRNLQVVFQDSYSSVNPRLTAEKIIAEPLENYEKLSAGEQNRAIADLLEQVGLSSSDMKKYPREFSGGQLQRINIARALALKPKMIVLDESVSSLDMVTQTTILNLLQDLKTMHGLSYLFITHDIRAAYSISDTMAIMDKGQIAGVFHDKDEVFTSQQPAVKSLVDAMLPEHPRYRNAAAPKEAKKLFSR